MATLGGKVKFAILINFLTVLKLGGMGFHGGFFVLHYGNNREIIIERWGKGHGVARISFSSNTKSEVGLK